MRPAPTRGHSLLELLVATGIFVMVSVALSGVWMMYGRSLAKSGEVLAANSIARSATEGLLANGWDWLVDKKGTDLSVLSHDVTVERTVRGRTADITYNVEYALQFNEGGGTLFPALADQDVLLAEDLVRVEVIVRWRSSVSQEDKAGDDKYNNEAVYAGHFYRYGI